VQPSHAYRAECCLQFVVPCCTAVVQDFVGTGRLAPDRTRVEPSGSWMYNSFQVDAIAEVAFVHAVAVAAAGGDVPAGELAGELAAGDVAVATSVAAVVVVADVAAAGDAVAAAVAGHTKTNAVEAKVMVAFVAATSDPGHNCCTMGSVCEHCPCSAQESWGGVGWQEHCGA